jgi:tripeptide aminopeptidase
MINEQRLVDLFLMMCRVNTPARHEKVLVDQIQPLLEEIGLLCVRDGSNVQTGSDTGNLIATLPATVEGAPPIFFSTHFDTVEPNPNLQIVIEDGVIKTDGTSILGADDKGGMAPIIEAMRVIQERGIPHGEVQLLLTACEEIGLLGARYIDRTMINAKFGYVLDTGPPVGNIVYTAPTQESMDIRLIGRPAHAGFEPEKGISAIQMAARAIERMKLGRIDPETTSNIGVVHGGTATNIVCAEVNLRAEARSRNNEKLQAQVQHMVETFEQTAAEFGGKAEVTVRHMYDTYNLSESEPVIQTAMAAANRLGLEPSLKEAGGGSDANYFNTFGIPTCVIGTGMRQIHTHQENIAISDLVKDAEWVIAIIETVANSHI